ncbi:hypothetical protein CFOL_v3_01721, partial [Cephalotus follicularis]
LTNKPLKQVLAKPDTSGRLIKWSVKLGEYDVKFEARPAIKSQVLADFVGDNTLTECMEEDPSESKRGLWKLSVDGSSCITGSVIDLNHLQFSWVHSPISLGFTPLLQSR